MTRSSRIRWILILRGFEKGSRITLPSDSMPSSSLRRAKTLKSILVSAGARLAPFDIQEVREITMYDELGLDTSEMRKPLCS